MQTAEILSFVCYLSYGLLWRWKEECSSIARKMELKMNDARNELTRERRRNEELTRLLRESRDKTIEVCVVYVLNSLGGKFWVLSHGIYTAV